MIVEKVEVKVSKDAADEMAKTVLSRWNDSVLWQSQELCGKYSVKEALYNCYNQRHGILSSEDQEIVNAVGVDAYVNLSELKSGALISWLRDLLLNTPELPFVISPTPIPELSDRGRQIALNRTKRELLINGYDGDLIELIRSIKASVMENEEKYAQDAAAGMYKLMRDQCYQGGFRSALYGTIDDLAVYPFAVMHGPVPTRAPKMVWRGNKLTTTMEDSFAFRPVSVWDFTWSPDSPDSQRGTGVNIRERFTRQQLFECMKLPSYIQANVEKVIRACESGIQRMSWLSTNPEQQDLQQRMWRNGGTVEAIRHYGFFSGKELAKYGITGLDDMQFYNASVTVIGEVTIQAFVLPSPDATQRPVYATSFEKTSDRIPGSSICQKIRDVERCYMAMLRFAVKNAGYASEPITEADYTRLAKYMAPEDIGSLVPGMLYLTDPDMSGGSQAAFRFHDVPSNTGSYINIMQYFSDLADRITQLPASLHGEPVGTGANRTYRGMAMLYGNALKPIQSALANMDEYMFKPLGTQLYNLNMRFSDDEDIKGDCEVQAQGATGLLQKEVAKQTAMETLQVVAQVGAAAQGLIPPQAVAWAMDQVLRTSGVPSAVLDSVTQGAPAPVTDPTTTDASVTGAQLQGVQQ